MALSADGGQGGPGPGVQGGGPAAAASSARARPIVVKLGGEVLGEPALSVVAADLARAAAGTMREPAPARARACWWFTAVGLKRRRCRSGWAFSRALSAAGASPTPRRWR